MLRACGHRIRTATRTYVTSAGLQNHQQWQRVALVQGASRGLGLEFCRQLLQRGPQQLVIATCRHPEAASELLTLQQGSPNLHILQLDCRSEESIERAAASVAQLVPSLDLLINVAGVLHNSAGLAPETALSRVTQANLLTSFTTNAFGPILVTQAFAPLLVSAAQHTGADAERPAVVANLSARVGSIGDNLLGGWYSYRASKAALNQLTKCAALEFERRRQAVACILLHPGTCDTDLSKPFQKNVAAEKLFSRERGVQQLLGIIERTSMRDTGKFFAWDGQEIVW